MHRLLNVLIWLLPLALPLYVVRFALGPFPTTALEIFVIVFVLTWFAIRGRAGIRNAHGSLAAWRWPVLAWLIVTLVAVFVARDHWGALGYWRAFMLEPVLVFVVLADLMPSGRRHLLSGIATVTILLGVYAIIQYFTGWGIPSPWNVWNGRRATGTFGFPNGLALFAAPFGTVCFMEWIRRVWDGDRQSVRLFFLAGAAAAAISVLLAKSMGGMLAFGLGVVLVLIFKKQTRRIGLALGALGLIVSAVAGVYLYRTQLNPLTIGDSIATTKKWSSMVRTVIWRESWQVVKARPLLGTGLRSYQTAVAPFHTATWMEIYPHPHNIVLMLWIETGLMGLLAFIWICYTWFKVISGQWLVTRRSNVTNAPTDHWPLATDHLLWLIPLIVILAHGMVDMPYFKNDLAMQFWILAALATWL